MVGYWCILKKLLAIQAKWKRCVISVFGWIEDSQIQEVDIGKVFGNRGWGTSFEIGDVRLYSFKFQQLLLNTMINDDVIHAMVSILRDRLASSPYRSHIIGISTFIQAIKAYQAMLASHPTRNRIALPLLEVEKALHVNPHLKLWIPVLESMHEVVLCVDYKEKTLSLGTVLLYLTILVISVSCR